MSYTPRAGSVASRVVEFFQANLFEELTKDDIAQKFDATPNNVHSLLIPVIEMEVLARTRNGDGEYVYHHPSHTVSDKAPAARKPRTAPAEKPAAPAPRTMSTPVRKMINIDALKVEEGIPYLGDQAKGKSKWQPLFDKLTKPGQSVQIPADMRGAVGAAIGKINRIKTHGTFKVALISDEHARVWRTA